MHLDDSYIVNTVCWSISSVLSNMQGFSAIFLMPKKNICVFPVSRPTLIFRATLNILLHF